MQTVDVIKEPGPLTVYEEEEWTEIIAPKTRLLDLGLRDVWRYRDLSMLLTFGIQLLMYATPVIYPLSSITDPLYRLLIQANPMTSVVETFRYAYLGSGSFHWAYLAYSFLFTVVILFIGTIIFNKVEKSFTDTV